MKEGKQSGRQYFRAIGPKRKMGKEASVGHKDQQQDSKRPLRRWEDSDFVDRTELGHGRFGRVFKAREQQSGRLVALKEVLAATMKKEDSFCLLKNEIEIHTRLLHPNIVRMYGFYTTQDKLVMVLEYLEGGDLFQRLSLSEGYLSEPEAANVLSQLVESLQYLRARHIIHRDIKPENILLSKEPSGEVWKLCDFTWAVHSLHEPRSTLCGTWEYLAPEVADRVEYDDKADLWSMGVLLFRILTGQLLIAGHDPEKIEEFLRSPRISFPKTPTVSAEAKQLTLKLLAANPEDRPSLEEVKADVWVRSNLATYKLLVKEQRIKAK